MQNKNEEYKKALEKLFQDSLNLLGNTTAFSSATYLEEYETKAKKEDPSLAYKEVKNHFYQDYPQIKVASFVKGILSCVAVLALILLLQQSNEPGLTTSSSDTLDPLRNIPLFSFGIFPFYIVLLISAAFETVFYFLWLDIVTLILSSYLLGMTIYVVISNPFTDAGVAFYLSLIIVAFLSLAFAIFFPKPYARRITNKQK